MVSALHSLRRGGATAPKASSVHDDTSGTNATHEALFFFRAVFLSAVAHSCFVLSVEEVAAMVNDTKLLIAAVEQRPALWMASHRQHNDKYVKAALWREVAATVMPGLGFEGKLTGGL